VRRAAIDALEELAAGQYRVFSEEQAFYENVTKDMLGRYQRVAPRAYEVPGAPDDWRRPLMVAQLSLGPRAVLSHRAAAAILGLDGVRPGIVEAVVPKGSAGFGWVLHRRRTPEPVYTGPLRHTNPLDTLVDLAAVVDDDTWEMAFESFLRHGLGTLDEVDARARHKGRRGARRMQRVLARRPAGAPPTGSELETRFIQLVRQSSIVPEPERQVRVGRYLLDGAWPPKRLFAELDGSWHDQAPHYDRGRQNDVVTITGWTPLRYTWEDVVHRPRTTLRKLEAAYVSAPSFPTPSASSA